MKVPQSDLDNLPDNALSNYVRVAVHHTACVSQRQSAEEIATEEKAAGYTTIPYNFVILGDGTVEVGRPIGKLPAATGGMNSSTLAICVEGDFQSDDSHYNGEVPTQKQIEQIAWIVNNWLKPKCLNLKYLIGHRDASVIEHDPSNATACPGNLLYARLHDVRLLCGLKEEV